MNEKKKYFIEIRLKIMFGAATKRKQVKNVAKLKQKLLYFILQNSEFLDKTTESFMVIFVRYRQRADQAENFRTNTQFPVTKAKIRKKQEICTPKI